MATRRKRRRNPAKLERCVAKVKARGSKVNPWAVCTAALQRAGELPRGKSRGKRRNPVVSEMDSEPYLSFDGNVSPATWEKLRPKIISRATKYANPYHIQTHDSSADYRALTDMGREPSGHGNYGRLEFSFTPTALATFIHKSLRSGDENAEDLARGICETLRLELV